MIKQLTTIQLTPSLDSPHYTVLKKTKEYEIRQYSPYLVAETNMPSDARPAGGDGFTELAGYIFGGNSRYVGHSGTCLVCLICMELHQPCDLRRCCQPAQLAMSRLAGIEEIMPWCFANAQAQCLSTTWLMTAHTFVTLLSAPAAWDPLQGRTCQLCGCTCVCSTQGCQLL